GIISQKIQYHQQPYLPHGTERKNYNVHGVAITSNGERDNGPARAYEECLSAGKWTLHKNLNLQKGNRKKGKTTEQLARKQKEEKIEEKLILAIDFHNMIMQSKGLLIPILFLDIFSSHVLQFMGQKKNLRILDNLEDDQEIDDVKVDY
uniref:Uncharacterized protein n=1 Tax=Romanomermis culicivorax TaxID=13658 RepID=A0A915IFA4_ROMCU